jgi:hypothetical protein
MDVERSGSLLAGRRENDGSQPEDKKTIEPPVPSIQKKDTSKDTDIALITWILFCILLSIGFGTFICLVAIPQGQRKGVRDEMEHEASTRGPKVLEEILMELRLLRVAVENQR